MAGGVRAGQVPRWARWGAVSLVVLTGCTGSASGGDATQHLPASLVSYVDVTSNHPDLGDVMRATGQSWFALSFLLAAGHSCTPTWGGSLAVDDPEIRSDIGAVRAAGGQVSVVSGGELGTYLENTCGTAAALASGYATALAATGTDRLDLDLEQPVQATLVADAVALLSRQRPVSVTVTLPVADATTGLDPASLPLPHALADNGITVTVNAMLLDFDYRGQWRTALLNAADSVSHQLTTLWPGTTPAAARRRLGLTLMAGHDDMNAVTTLDDARAVRDYARERGLAMLGLWSLARDNGGCAGRTTAADDCSGVAQRPYEFTDVLSGREP